METTVKPEEKKNHVIAARISENTYKKFKKYSEATGLGTDSKALAVLVELFLDSKMSDFTKKDLDWIKYIYIIDCLAKDMIDKFKEVHPEDQNTIGYMEFFLSPFYRLTESTIDFLDTIPKDTEAKLFDGITIMTEFLRRIKFEDCSLRRMSKTFGVALKEMEIYDV